ncbi:5-formyltetrahydrofolate cyclo-ligase, mitochondrial [Silene latifolia]|uniref:5-formyltetrahydrofolate cyclo-ligase, mitochondrial n=1 Tax=Silene latifolia TaxID=37657 RepID=UPI003D7834A1
MNKLFPTRQSAKQLKKLMTLISLNLHQPCTLASSPISTPSYFLNLRHSSQTSIKMSSTTTTIDGIHASTAELEPIFKEKKILRSKVKKSLREMTPSQRSHEDDVIQRLVLDAPWLKSSKRLCAYISCRPLREVDTSKILAEILQSSDKDSGDKLAEKKLYVPRVEDKKCHMRMLNITGMDDLIANSMDILEPAGIDSHGNEREDVMQTTQPVDLMILPGLAFDKSGRRLGRGGGYYDTFLSNYQQLANEKNWKQPLLVALSYSVQILEDEAIPITPNDVDIDALVSPAGIIPLTSAALHRMEHGI